MPVCILPFTTSSGYPRTVPTSPAHAPAAISSAMSLHDHQTLKGRALYPTDPRGSRGPSISPPRSHARRANQDQGMYDTHETLSDARDASAAADIVRDTSEPAQSSGGHSRGKLILCQQVLSGPRPRKKPPQLFRSGSEQHRGNPPGTPRATNERPASPRRSPGLSIDPTAAGGRPHARDSCELRRTPRRWPRDGKSRS